VQVSLDAFASCIGFSAPLAAMSVGNTVATLQAAPGLLVNRQYQIRVTTAAESAAGLAIGSQYTSANGFSTTSPNICDGSVVITQVYGGGGNAGATFRNDYVELHNRGTTPVNLNGASIQYAAAAGNTWQPVALSGTIQPGAFYLVQLASGGVNGVVLPASDAASAGVNMAVASGKVALVTGITALPVNTCPDPTRLIDFVGYGAVNCSEGSAIGITPAPTLTVTTAALRNQLCGDVNLNNTDFTALTLNAGQPPHNSASAASICACSIENESNSALEANYCDVQSPLGFSVQTGTATPTIYGQIYEAGLTEAPGPNGRVRAQLGFGPLNANPQYQAGWTWLNANYNVQAGNNDEYQATFTAPAVGTYGYAYRFSIDSGVSWTLCDQNAAPDFGAGSNPGETFNLGDVPTMTVTP
jgi:hypothetical protein